MFDENLNSGTVFNEVIHDLNEALLNIVYKYDIQEETRILFESITSSSYMDVIETGTHDEIKDYMANMIDPMT